jgi:UDP-N-acetylglucosamine--N-acetylmuramyl-(pentapeptide) pyrophosphoryl-undecaprenol N-acetylglucosamine transferase
VSKGGVLIAGGGTGGHIYPAVAVAQALMKIQPELPIAFVGTRKGLETRIIPREGFPLYFVNVGALNSVGLLTKIFTLLLLPLAILQACFLILKSRPRVILGVGGYASGPVMIAGKLLGRRLVLFEPNAYPGLTNRWLGRVIDKAYVNFEVTMKNFRKAEVVGIPIRQGLLPGSRVAGKKLRVLIFGGSQGARGINTTVLQAVKQGGAWLEQVEIVHQIGSRDFQAVKKEYDGLKKSGIEYQEFLYDMPQRYSWADLVVCRAGASTLAELAACHKAAVLIPFPHAADNHQLKNAEALADQGGASIILQKDFTPEKFIQTLSDFATAPSKISELENKIARFYRAQSAEKIAASMLEQSV